MCIIKSKTDDLLMSQTKIMLKGKYEIEDASNNIIGRVVVTEETKNLMNGITNIFSFGKKKEEPEVIVEKNEIKAILFKRMGKDKMVFCEGRLINKWKLFQILPN